MKKRVIAVMSGKGGVGKSTVATLLAMLLSKKYNTVLVDTDICGPSTISMLGAKGSLVRSESGFRPVAITESLSLLSFGLSLKPEDTVVWRGAKKHALLELFFGSVSDSECVVIDTPPGISEEHAFLKDKNVQILFVTTPQNVALNDTQRLIEFMVGDNNKSSVLGIIENMSAVCCESCGERFPVFGRRGGEMLAAEYGLPFLGQLELDLNTGSFLDNGTLVKNLENSNTYSSLVKIVEKINI